MELIDGVKKTSSIVFFHELDCLLFIIQIRRKRITSGFISFLHSKVKSAPYELKSCTVIIRLGLFSTSLFLLILPNNQNKFGLDKLISIIVFAD